MRLDVPLLATHLALVDRVASDGAGSSREAVLRAAMVAHARHILAGGSPHDPGPWSAMEADKPALGPERFEQRLDPGCGRAVPVYRGEVLRCRQLVGRQCIDFNGYNLHDYKEYLDNGFNRQRGLQSGPGTLVWSGSPRGRPMYLILDASPSFAQFYEGHRCNGILLEREYGFTDHPNCQDTFAEAIREYGLTPDDVHDSYNLWMHTFVDEHGNRVYDWNRAEKDDFVEMLALVDTLSVAVCCPSHMTSTNNYDPQPVEIAVHEATPASLALADEIQARWGRFRTQQRPQDFKLPAIRTERELRPDPSWRPEFRPMPARHTVAVDLADAEVALLEGLMATGFYGATVGEAARAAFLRWYDQNRLVTRYARVEIHR